MTFLVGRFQLRGEAVGAPHLLFILRQIQLSPLALYVQVAVSDALAFLTLLLDLDLAFIALQVNRLKSGRLLRFDPEQLVFGLD